MELDPRLTFDSFVVGAANRLAAAAARRAADIPGRSYNPLFLYSPSGLGKSHILSAIAHQSMRLHPERNVVYQPLEVYLGELTRALERGERQALEARYAALSVLLLDDVQFLTGQEQAQAILLTTLDAITTRGGQVVLASDRPPSDIDGLDARLLSRFSAGLIVDMGQPDMETRVAILRRKAEERGARLAVGAAEQLARFPFRNVRELQGALNRVLAVQDLEERTVEADELPRIVGVLPGGRDRERAGVEGDAPAWRRELRRAADAAREEGFSAQRLERLLRAEAEPGDWEVELRGYRSDLERIREIRAELDDLGNPWPEAAATLLGDPERLDEAEALLASARERARPFARLPEGPSLEELADRMPPLALRAASRLLSTDRPDYNPLYVHAEDPTRGRMVLEAAGRDYLEANPGARVGSISVTGFAEEFIRAISDGVAGAWRERWWTVEVLLLHGLEDLAQTERAQDEFFHLFEALKRRDARIFLAADRPPAGIENVHERLRSRFEGGLVVDLGGAEVATPAPAARDDEPVAWSAGESMTGPEITEPADESAATEPSEGPGADEPAAAASEPTKEPDAAEPAPTPAATEPAEEPRAAEPAAAEVPSPDPPEQPSPQPPGAPEPAGDVEDDLAALLQIAGMGRSLAGVKVPDASAEGDENEPWKPSPERVVWHWPAEDDRIVEDF